MKFAFSTLACPAWSVEQIIENAVQMGYEGIELRLLDGEVIEPVRDAEKVKDAVTLSLAHNLDVCALDTSCQLNQSLPENRAQQLKDIQNWLRLAAEVQVPLLRVFGGQGQSDQDPENEDLWVTDLLKQIAPLAEKSQVKIVLETHDAFSSARRVAKILNAVDSPFIGALWDSHHPYRVGESAEEVMQLLGKRVFHVHVKDARRIPPANTHWQLVLLGEGEVPVQEQLRQLKQHNYTGYVSVEWEKRWHLELANPEIALPEHMAELKLMQASL